jgi:predicted nucleotidyltransferase
MAKGMKLPADFVELLAEFERAEVRYLVIGGYAVSFHDRPRTTKDLDLLIDPDPGNIENACRALAEFGAPASVVGDLRSAGVDEVIWMGNPPLRIDLLKSAPGVELAAFERALVVPIQGIGMRMIALDDLILSKRAVHRAQDVADAENLELARHSHRRG